MYLYCRTNLKWWLVMFIMIDLIYFILLTMADESDQRMKKKLEERWREPASESIRAERIKLSNPSNRLYHLMGLGIFNGHVLCCMSCGFTLGLPELNRSLSFPLQINNVFNIATVPMMKLKCSLIYYRIFQLWTLSKWRHRLRPVTVENISEKKENIDF